MARLEDLVRHEPASSSLALRERIYGAEERSMLLRDIVALANAATEGPRFLLLGLREPVGGQREVCGVEPADWTAFKSVLAGVAQAIEPTLKLTARSLTISGKLVGVVCLPSCAEPPYLLNAKPGSGLQAGAGWIRRGTECLPLLRADLARLFAARQEEPADECDVAIGFPGDPPQNEITIAALSIDELPSAVAAERLRAMLEAQRDVKAAFGRTQTQLSRLMHARIFGVEQPYERHSEDSLRLSIERTAEDSRAADEHYQFELRAHKLEVVVCNRRSRPLSDATLRVTLPRLEGVGVAERLYAKPGASCGDGYPRVTTNARTVDIDAAIGIVPPGSTVSGFREAPRLWARPPAAGKTIAVDCTLHARELREPLHETLVARIVREAAA